MKTKKTILLATTIFTYLSQSAFAKPHPKQIFLNEEYIEKSLKESPPNLEIIEANFLTDKYNEKSALDKFQFQVEAQSSFQDTSERQLTATEVITGPVTSHSVGIVKPLKLGMNIGAKVYTEKASTNFFKNATSTGLSFELYIDLFKDFLGRLTNAKLDALKYQKIKSKLYKKIQTQAFLQQLKKIYWSLVANNESLKITEALLETAIKQAENAHRRKKNSVADAGEVAKYESQVSARKANIIYLNYQKEALVQQLKELLPQTSNAELLLAPYDLDQTVEKVISCTELIKSNKEVPMNYTYYDEILKANIKQFDHQKKITERYDNWDISISSEFKTIGKDIGLSKSIEDHNENKKNSFQAVLQLTIPLGKAKKSTEDLKKIIDRKRHIAEQHDIVAKMNAFHFQVIKSIDLLYQVVKNQKENSRQLAISLKETQRKYNQARISVHNLISDQEAYLQSNLNEIQTKLTIVTTLLDYLSVFNSTPCKMNRIKDI